MRVRRGKMTKRETEATTATIIETGRGAATMTARHPGALGGRRGKRRGKLFGSISSVT